MSDARTLKYLNAVDAAIKNEGNEIMTTMECTECGTSITSPFFNTAEHWIMFDTGMGENVVVIGCEGYWIVDPKAVGLDRENWSGIEGVNV